MALGFGICYNLFVKNIAIREDIPRLYTEEKLSTVKIANLCGLTPPAVASILKHRGITIRSNKEARAIQYPNGTHGDLHPKWNGGKTTTSNGHIYIYSPNHPYRTKQNRVMEHRLVMEKYLGRYLDPKEIIHHINGNKKDNRIENLYLHKSKSDHVKMHFDAVKEVIRLKNILDKNNVKY